MATTIDIDTAALDELAGGDPAVRTFLHRVARDLARMHDKAEEASDATTPVVEAAEAKVRTLEARIQKLQVQLDEAKAAHTEAIEVDSRSDGLWSQVDELVRLAPEAAEAVGIEIDPSAEPPQLGEMQALWRRLPGCESLSLPPHSFFAGELVKRVDDLRRRGVPVPLLRSALHRRRAWLDARASQGGTVGSEPEHTNAALAALLTWES